MSAPVRWNPRFNKEKMSCLTDGPAECLPETRSQEAECFWMFEKKIIIIIYDYMNIKSYQITVHNLEKPNYNYWFFRVIIHLPLLCLQVLQVSTPSDWRGGTQNLRPPVFVSEVITVIAKSTGVPRFDIWKMAGGMACAKLCKFWSGEEVCMKLSDMSSDFWRTSGWWWFFRRSCTENWPMCFMTFLYFPHHGLIIVQSGTNAWPYEIEMVPAGFATFHRGRPGRAKRWWNQGTDEIL